MRQESTISLRAYTPGSDYAFGAGGTVQVIWGRGGNDIMIGYNPLRRNSLSAQIDLMVADLDDAGLPEPGPVRNWDNVFKFGDAKQAYYLDNVPFGFTRYALVGDFERENDTITLHGSADNYQLVSTSLGTGVFYVDSQGRQDLVTFLLGNQDLELDSDYFEFEQEGLAEPFNSDVNQFGTQSIDQSQTIVADSEDNIYIGGSTGGNLRGINRGGTRDFWIGKYNTEGETIKVNQFGTPGLDQVSEIVIGSQGDLFWSGFSTGDFAAPNQGERDIVVAKYDSNLKQVWARQYGGDSIDISNDLAIDSEDNVYVIGVEAIGLGEDDTTIVKFDTDGNELWTTTIGLPGIFDEGYQITLGPDGSVYAVGWTVGDLAGTGNAGLYDIWYAELDPDTGDVNWLKQFGSRDYEFPWGIVTDSQGDIYMAGWTLGNLGGPNAGSYDVWLRKTDSDGNEIFTKQYGTADDDGLFKEALHIDGNDNLYFTGYTNSNFAGENLGGFDAWIRQVNTNNGSTIWQEQFGTDRSEFPYDLFTDASGEDLYLTGLTEGSFGTNNLGSTDIWSLKLNAENGSFKSFNPNSNLGSNLIDSTISTGITSGEPQIAVDVLSAELNSVIANTMEEHGHLMETQPTIGMPF